MRVVSISPSLRYLPQPSMELGTHCRQLGWLGEVDCAIRVLKRCTSQFRHQCCDPSAIHLMLLPFQWHGNDTDFSVEMNWTSFGLILKYTIQNWMTMCSINSKLCLKLIWSVMLFLFSLNFIFHNENMLSSACPRVKRNAFSQESFLFCLVF